jgi:hypothetical protein
LARREAMDVLNRCKVILFKGKLRMVEIFKDEKLLV